MNLPGVALSRGDLDRLARSGISCELATQALLRRVTSSEAAATVGRKDSGEFDGVLFPYIWPGEDRVREFRLRRDRPDLEAKAEGGFKERGKYLSPPGRGNLVYFVPGTAAEWLTDPTLPVIITEGEKKCLALWELASLRSR